MEEVSKKKNNGSPADGSNKPKRRLIKTAFQLEALERTYLTTKCISWKVRAELSVKLGLTDQQLLSWFYRREQKDKKLLAAHVAKLGSFDSTSDESRGADLNSDAESPFRWEPLPVRAQQRAPVRADGPVVVEFAKKSPDHLRKRGRNEIEGTGQPLPGVLADPKKQKVFDLQESEPGQGCSVTVGPDEKWNAGTKAPAHALKIFTLLQDAEHYVDISRKEKAERMRRRAGQFMADAMVIAAEYEATADAVESKGICSEIENLKKKNMDLVDHPAKSSSKIEDLVAQKTSMEKEIINLGVQLKAWKERAEKAEGFKTFLSSQVKELNKNLKKNAFLYQCKLKSPQSAHQSETKKLSAKLKNTNDELERNNKNAVPYLRAGYSLCLGKFVAAGADPQVSDLKTLRNKLRGYSKDDIKELIRETLAGKK